MCKFTKVYMKAGELAEVSVISRNIILDKDRNFIYGEFIGAHSKNFRDLKKITDEITDERYPKALFSGETTTKFYKLRDEHYKSIFEKLSRGQGSSIVYHVNSLSGKNANIIISKDEMGVLEMFKKWLVESQPLPYVNGYLEDLEEEAEAHLFKLLEKENAIVKLSSDEEHTVIAYEIDKELCDASEIMQKCILQVAKDSNLLEIDRIRKTLSLAPNIGKADTKSAKVFVSLQNVDTKIIYHVIEYDKNQDNSFCLVDSGKDILWEEYSFEGLFNNESIAVLKQEQYTNITIDINGKIAKMA